MRKRLSKYVKILSLTLAMAVLITELPLSYASQDIQEKVVEEQYIEDNTLEKNNLEEPDISEDKLNAEIDVSTLEQATDPVDEVTDEMLFSIISEGDESGEIEGTDLTYEQEYVELDYYGLLQSVDVASVNSENIWALDATLRHCTLEEIGEWMYNLSIEDQDKVIELSEFLNDDVFFILEEGDIEEETYMKYWELAQAQYFSSQISFFGWVDEFYGGEKGNARFFIKFYCDGELVGTYTIDASNVTQPANMTTSQLSVSSTISGSVKPCSKGHNLNVSFSKIEAVTDSKAFWSGIRLYGKYTRPAGYVVTDYATAENVNAQQGLGVMGYTRFGTDTYGGSMSYSNDALLDARYNSTAKVDNFVFEGNMYQTGLYDVSQGGGKSVDNYGNCTYHIEVYPSGKSYRINPNGGYYNGSTATEYHEALVGSGTTLSVGVPVWNSTTEGKKFVGWTLSDSALVVNSGVETVVEDKISTTAAITLGYGADGGKDGKYINKTVSQSKYTSYISWDTSGICELKAIWELDWMKVNFDTNRPSGVSESVTNMAFTSKNVYYNKAYGELPAPELYGYYFMGWFTHPTDGTQVSASTICKATGTHTLYAHWQKALFHINFNTNRPSGYESATVGGMTNYTSGKQGWYQKAYGYLPSNGLNTNWPTPTISGVTFLGWFTSPVGGTQITNTTIFNSLSDVTLYAHWNEALYLDVTTNLTYNPYTIGSDTFYKGGADLDWSAYKATTGRFNTYRKLTSAASYTTTNTGVTIKKYADKAAVDTAAPNAITSYSTSKVGSSTRVSLVKPSDKGTSYTFYVDERASQTTGFSASTYTHATGTRSHPVNLIGKVKIELWGAGAATGGKGAYITGSREYTSTGTIYFVTGGKSSATTGGYNGGGAGNTGGGDSYGGGGCTHVATSSRGLTSAYASYSGEIIAVAGGGGGKGGSPSIVSNIYGGATSDKNATAVGSGGNSGASGGSCYNLQISSNGYAYTKGANGGTISTGGSGVSTNTNIKGYGSETKSGSGGGGGAGWAGGGGGSGGASFGTTGSSSGDANGKKGKSGSNGGTGTGGAGGAGFSTSADSRNSPVTAAGGGGGAGGSSVYGGLTGATLTNGNNSGAGQVRITPLEDYNGKSYKTSNYETEVITTGVYGYRYIIDTSSSTSVAYNAGTFVKTDYVDVPNKSTAQYVHIAPQDRAGNIGSTIHVYIEPTYTISYNLDGGKATPANPAGYTPSTLPITLNNPVQDGYEFIGWTGSNGTTPQMTVTLPVGTTGNKSYTANWAKDVPIVTAMELEGDVYKKADKEYYIQAGKVFNLSFQSYIANKAGTAIGSVEYTPTNNIFQVKNKSGVHIQDYNAQLGMTEFLGYIGVWDMQEEFMLKIPSVTNTRTSDYKYFKSVTKSMLENHLDSVSIYPKAGVIKGSKEKWSADFDETKKVTITADIKAPVLTDNIKDDGVYTEGVLPITVKTADADSGESGIKNLKITIENLDTGYKETLCNIINSSYVTSSSFTYKNSKGTEGLILGDNNNYVGKLKINVSTSDNVNNITEMEKTVYVIGLSADIQRMLPTIDTDGNPIPDNVFKDGEQGEIIINTTGYMEKLEIVFDTEIEKLAEKHDYEFKEDVVIPLPNNGDGKNIYIRTTPNTDPDTLKPYRTDEYFFYVPEGTWNPNASDLEENTHYVVIRAYKGDKVLSNVLAFGGTGEGDSDGDGIPDSEDPNPDVPADNPITDDNFVIEGRLETEIRTRIREAY